MAQLDDRLSNRYGAAIFELSLERGGLNENLKQALVMRDALADKDCHNIITHPHISATDKIAFFDEAFKEHVSEELMGFLYLAVNKNRTRFIVPILSSFIDMANDHVRRTTAQIVSAVPLEARQVTALAALLSKKTNKQVSLDLKVDPTIIGGLYIRVDGYFMDTTIRTRLQEIKLSLKEHIATV